MYKLIWSTWYNLLLAVNKNLIMYWLNSTLINLKKYKIVFRYYKFVDIK